MFQSINPYTGIAGRSFNAMTEQEVEKTIVHADQAFQQWRQSPAADRAGLVVALGMYLRTNRQKLAEVITEEMGKIIREAEAEIEKCAWLCEYYAEHGMEMLEEQGMESDGTVSYVRFDPLGVILAIMPWNFPFWQVLRFAVPAILAGNTVVLKHAPNVFGCAREIEKAFRAAGFPEGVLLNLFISEEQAEFALANPLIQGVTLTGSQRAGRAVASVAGKHLKKTVLELGGSDPYIVLSDANLEAACQTAVDSRMLNAGQVCIAAKRFIVEESVLDDFVESYKKLLRQLRLGDPMDRETQIGPVARRDLLETLDRQVRDSIKQGAHLITGGIIVDERFYAPTLLTEVQKGMPVYDEETFGPVAAVIKAKNPEEAVRLANDTPFGLGASIWTRDLQSAEEMAQHINAGAVFINGMVKSDPRLPFGGVRQSGYGRELSVFGIREFTNIKTIWIK